MAKKTDPVEEIKSLTESDEYNSVLDKLKEHRAAFIDDNYMFAHVDGLIQIMARLKNRLSPPPEPIKVEPGIQDGGSENDS